MERPEFTVFSRIGPTFSSRGQDPGAHTYRVSDTGHSSSRYRPLRWRVFRLSVLRPEFRVFSRVRPFVLRYHRP